MNIKQGETFSLTGQYLDDDGITPKSLAGVILKSQIRDKYSVFVVNLEITITNEPLGTYTITAPLGTASWQVGQHYWDIKEIVGGVTRLTDTHIITVTRAETLI